ncbi:MAG: c-type cytochrome domain-containing protein [Planctomycetaceae bacterium]
MCRIVFCLSACIFSGTAFAEQLEPPDFTKQIAPLFRRHCTSCHNADDREGRLSLASFADLKAGGQHGPSIQPGDLKSSRLFLMVSGQTKPEMPPDGNKSLNATEIALLKRWIETGARGPAGNSPDSKVLHIPRIAAAELKAQPVGAIAVSPDGKLLAIARFGSVEIISTQTQTLVHRFQGLPGKVNSVEFAQNGRWVVAGSGVAGLYGQATVWSLQDRKIMHSIDGHRDVLYAATVSPDGKFLATASYDRRIMLWDLQSRRKVRTFSGHNGAIFDLVFSPDGRQLASASADSTIKLWHVAKGIRLDTLSQPLKEQYVVRFSPDGRFIIAGGLDNRIRVWHVVCREEPQINPLIYARIAHEGAITQLDFTPDGKSLISAADDRSLKLWETDEFTQIHAYSRQPHIAASLAMAPDGQSFFVGRMDGSIQKLPVVSAAPIAAAAQPGTAGTIPADLPWQELQESEPNHTTEKATVLTLPAKVKGRIYHDLDAAGMPDVDLFRFTARSGQTWIFEVNAERSKSPLDSTIAILDVNGRPVPRVLLQAVRDSYIRFRGINATTRDCRLQNWEEMDLNQYLYLNGEVVSLWLWPRGPDSGYIFYEQAGKRINYFGTTATSHPLQEPCYIVEPHPPGTQLISNGLPVFPVNYGNDDDPERELGSDSRLKFTAPVDGTYFARLSDVRGFSGENFTYELTARPARPDFDVTLGGVNPSVPVGSGREFSVSVNRIDGYSGPVAVSVTGLPPGFHVSSPLIIQPGQFKAYGTINAASDAPQPTSDNAKATTVTATATINGKNITHNVNNFGEIKLTDAPEFLVAIGPDHTDAAEATVPEFGMVNPLELTISPGETMTARVHIRRSKDFTGRVGFEAIAQNLPHGVIVDNVGLSGLLIVEGTSQRKFYLTAADWVSESSRIFHLKSREKSQTSWPIIVHVKQK